MSRLEQIQAFLVDEPHDVFLRYTLALELDKAGRSDESLVLFDTLIGETPAYIPASFMAGQMLARLGRTNEARDYLRVGIESARVQKDSHAAGEMSDFLVSLGELGE